VLLQLEGVAKIATTIIIIFIKLYLKQIILIFVNKINVNVNLKIEYNSQ